MGNSDLLTLERKGHMKKTLKLAVVAGVVALAASVLSTSSASAAASCADFKQFGSFSNHPTVKVFAGIRDPEATVMTGVFAHFTACTGIKIAYEGTDQFETLLPVRVKGGNAPDIAIIPQPGLVATMVATGKAVPVTAKVLSNINKYYNPAWKTFTTVGGKVYGSPFGASSKSLVWYSPAAFKKIGATIPTTWAQMDAIAAKFKAAGVTP